MLTRLGSLSIALSLLPASFSQEPSGAAGFEALGGDPYTAALFEELNVSPGAPARVLAQQVHGDQDGKPFVNVLRWTDARAYRGRLVALRLPVRLDEPSVETSARLWVRVHRADGTVGYEDAGLDGATSASEWTTLSSIGAIAEDATDLWFGLIVEGATLVHMQDFALEVRDEVSSEDARHLVPDRWVRNPDVQSSNLVDAGRGLDLRVTTFIPPGHDLAHLPHVWCLRDDSDLRRSFVDGGALLEGMRLGQEPPTIVSLVQPREGRLPEIRPSSSEAAALLGLLGGTEVGARGAATQMVVACPVGTASATVLASAGGAPGLSPAAAEAMRGLPAAESYLHAERVLVRWARACQDAGGDRDLLGLLFDASLVSLDAWGSTPMVEQASHSLSGHDCGHDHSHEGHDHEGHDHEGHDHEGHDHEGHDHEGHDHEGHDHEGHDHEGHDH